MQRSGPGSVPKHDATGTVPPSASCLERSHVSTDSNFVEEAALRSGKKSSAAELGCLESWCSVLESLSFPHYDGIIAQPCLEGSA
jgi:hypothetical protein